MNYLKKQNNKVIDKENNLIKKFKNRLIEKLKKTYPPYVSKTMRIIIEQLPQTNLRIEFTDRNVDYSWNAYLAVLHISVNSSLVEIFEKEKTKILDAATGIFNMDDYELSFRGEKFYSLDEISIEDSNIPNRVIDLSNKANNDILKLAIEDANKFMYEGNYTSALDRVHTFFMGYIRENLRSKGIEYTENETLNQLFKKIYSFYESEKLIDKKIGTILKSMTGAISSINDLRNKNSLSHPNENIVNNRDAKLAIETVKMITNYLEEIKC